MSDTIITALTTAIIASSIALVFTLLLTYGINPFARKRVVTAAIIAEANRLIDWSVVCIRAYFESIASIQKEQEYDLKSVDILNTSGLDFALDRCDVISSPSNLSYLFEAISLTKEINSDKDKVSSIISSQNTQQLSGMLYYRIIQYLRLIEAVANLADWANKTDRFELEAEVQLSLSNIQQINDLIKNMDETERQGLDPKLSCFQLQFEKIYPRDLTLRTQPNFA